MDPPARFQSIKGFALVVAGFCAGVLAYGAMAPALLDPPVAMKDGPKGAFASRSSEPFPVATDSPATAPASSPLAVFSTFPENAWVKVPRGLMEVGSSLDSLLFVVSGGGDDSLAMLRSMLPGAPAEAVQGVGDGILELSQEWAQLAVGSLRRQGPNAWQLTLPADQAARLREAFRQKVAALLGSGDAHIVHVLTHRSLTILFERAQRLSFDPVTREWLLQETQGTGHAIDASTLKAHSPVRLLLERAQAMP